MMGDEKALWLLAHMGGRSERRLTELEFSGKSRANARDLSAAKG